MIDIICKNCIFLVGLAMLTGCMGLSTVQHVPIPSLDDDPESAIIILKRVNSSNFLSQKNPSVFDNGKLIGEISTGGELKWSRKEGTIKLDISHVSTSGTNGLPAANIHREFKVYKNNVYTLRYLFGYYSVIALEGDIRVSSTPPGALIYSGSSFGNLRYTGFKTPHTWKLPANATNWRSEYYQVHLDGYEDPPIKYRDNKTGDREINFELKQKLIAPSQPLPDKPNEYINNEGGGR